MRYALALHSRPCILDSVPSQSVYSRTLSTLDSSTIESTETRTRIRKHRECENAEYRESRLQGVQNREEGAQCTMRSQCEVQRRECNVRVQSRECRVESAESARAQSLEGAQCTMRAQFESAESECRLESTESARMKNVLECKTRECRVEGTESARMQSRECNLRVQRRECRDCENPKSRVQRL
jgi:hypothetical protein